MTTPAVVAGWSLVFLRTTALERLEAALAPKRTEAATRLAAFARGACIQRRRWLRRFDAANILRRWWQETVVRRAHSRAWREWRDSAQRVQRNWRTKFPSTGRDGEESAASQVIAMREAAAARATQTAAAAALARAERAVDSDPSTPKALRDRIKQIAREFYERSTPATPGIPAPLPPVASPRRGSATPPHSGQMSPVSRQPPPRSSEEIGGPTPYSRGRRVPPPGRARLARCCRRFRRGPGRCHRTRSRCDSGPSIG